MKKTVLCAIALSFGLSACAGDPKPKEFRRFYNINTGEQFCEDLNTGKKFACELPPPRM